ncbi:MAG: hypothetical protein B6I38_03715, partial [Anaerolineaceae bacterium 4572_5.1]
MARWVSGFCHSPCDCLSSRERHFCLFGIPPINGFGIHARERGNYFGRYFVDRAKWSKCNCSGKCGSSNVIPYPDNPHAYFHARATHLHPNGHPHPPH